MNPFDILSALGPPIEWALTHLTRWFLHVGPISGSAFGFAIVVVTLCLRMALFPVFGWQVRTSRRLQAEQRLVAPELAELRKKYKKEPQKLNEEMMKLYREHGISPFSNLTGCLPLLVQMPILYGLYRGISSATKDLHQGLGFLWIGNVAKSPKDLLAQGVATHWSVIILPVLAAAASFVQAKMMMQPPRKDMSEQELKMYSLSKNMLYLAPGMVLLFGYQLPVGLGIYWLTQSCVMLVQQWLVIGWGGLKVPPWFPGAGRVTALSYRTDGTSGVSHAPPKRRPGGADAATPAKQRGGAAGSTRPASAPGGVSNGRAPRSVTSRAPGGAARPSQGSVRRRGRGR
ncbi:MAG: YidC/Oxa1 family membrane protein insertase [Chloroflexi bacterium]|nr:MAG: YidC/Oxa1 family membrane protein insertase [Chloroflexota bacterium]